MSKPDSSQPYYTVHQSLQGARLFVWVQHDTEDEEKNKWVARYCQHATSNPARYCKVVAKATKRANRLNAKRAALQIVMKKGCN